LPYGTITVALLFLFCPWRKDSMFSSLRNPWDRRYVPLPLFRSRRYSFPLLLPHGFFFNWSRSRVCLLFPFPATATRPLSSFSECNSCRPISPLLSFPRIFKRMGSLLPFSFLRRGLFFLAIEYGHSFSWQIFRQLASSPFSCLGALQLPFFSSSL